MRKFGLILSVLMVFVFSACAPASAPLVATGVTAQATIPVDPTEEPGPTPEAAFTATNPIVQASVTQQAAPTEKPTATLVPVEPTAPSSPSASGYIREGRPIIVDHTSVDLFEQIPDEYLQAARNIQMMYSDRSVGQNINESLNCLSAPSWAKSPPFCRVDYTGPNWAWKTFTSNPPARIDFSPDPQKYDRSNWVFVPRTGEWDQLTKDFVVSLAPEYLEKADVLSYQITYLNVQEGSKITDPEKGFFADNPDKYDVHDLEALIAEHPDKTFILWTTSLARGIGSQVSTDFNNQMRAYALEHNFILFDVADIESHSDQGEPCFDNRDGIEYCSQQGQCEDHPDDGLDLPAICQDYTTEPDGGHLGSVSGGGIRIAKAFWVLMAQIAGWEP